MRVSVIIPLFNKAPYIERALSSVAAQTYRDFELIVIDDGSTDGGPRFVEAFNNLPIRLIRQENAGPGAARNRGLELAQGELVAFLDADDEWLPDYLAESVRLLDQYGSDVALITSGYIEHPAGVSRERMWKHRGITEGVHCVDPDTSPESVARMLAYMSPCTTVARTAVVHRWGGFYDRDHCRYAEDAHLWLKILLNESVAMNLDPLARIHFEASGPTQTRRAARPVEPFLIHPEEIEASCPSHLREPLSRVLAIRALKTACVLSYWGDWRAARSLRNRFAVAGGWRLPKYFPAQICSTPLGSALGKAWRLFSGLGASASNL